MDSRDIPQPSYHQLQQPPGMLMNLYSDPNAVAVMGSTLTSQSIHHLLPFGSLAHQQHHPQLQPPQTLQQQQQMDQKTLGFGDGSLSSQSMQFGFDQNQIQNQQQVKKKRGRPRKYTPHGNIALGLAPTSPHISATSNSYGGGGDVGVGDSGGGGNANAADPPAKRSRGRPLGSSKKQLDALGGTSGVGFIPHVIEVKTGEDIASKVMAFSNKGRRTICILSASGAVSRVTLRQASDSSRTVTHEGRFEIITLSGSFLKYEVNGSTNRSGSLSIALAGADGKILGGCVIGSLVAATEVQVIVGSFVAEAKKPEENGRGQNPEPASVPANMLNFGSNSVGQSSESSDENENENGSSPSMHRDNNNNGICENSVAQEQQQQQQLRHMQMYNRWPGQGH